MEELGRELDKALADGNWELASAILTKLWLVTQIHLTRKIDPDLKELTYLKTPVETDNGEYILLFIHTKGKKIEL